MCPHGERLLTGSGGLLGRAHMVCHCLLIEGSDGLVLVDTGFGTDDVRDPRRLGRMFTALVQPRMQIADTAVEQLRRLGFNAGDVRHIVLTHLDLDHAGGLPDFPDAEVHVPARELEAALHPSLRERQRYKGAHWAHGPRWIQHGGGGEEWFGFEGVRILPASEQEILLIPLTGHTRGHTGVAVKGPDGWLLHCGDAYFHNGELRTPPRCPPGLSAFIALNEVDRRKRLANVERLRELAARHGEDVQLICSHDPSYLSDAAVPASARAPVG